MMGAQNEEEGVDPNYRLKVHFAQNVIIRVCVHNLLYGIGNNTREKSLMDVSLPMGKCH